jgi:hypothetical protein
MQSGPVPKTWGPASFKIKNDFEKHMISVVPELRLCFDGWKVTKLGIETYPQWMNTQRHNKTVAQPNDSCAAYLLTSSACVKLEEENHDKDTQPDAAKPNKRPRSPRKGSNNTRCKKMKVIGPFF